MVEERLTLRMRGVERSGRGRWAPLDADEPRALVNLCPPVGPEVPGSFNMTAAEHFGHMMRTPPEMLPIWIGH